MLSSVSIRLVFIHLISIFLFFYFFFFNDTATTEIYTLSLHDALPIFFHRARAMRRRLARGPRGRRHHPDRKSTRLNSSHMSISYAVFCLKKKKKKNRKTILRIERKTI